MCYAIVKCATGSVLGDTVHLQSGVLSSIPTSFCTATVSVIPANIGFTSFKLASTSTNTIEFYEGTTLLAKLSLNVTGATGIISQDASVNAPNGGVSFCSPDVYGANDIFIYR